MSMLTPSSIEPLETRIAPATFTFADGDGDFVTIKTSKGSDANLANIIVPFLSVEGLGMELQKIDFSQRPAEFNGTDLSVTARRTSVGGDGLVNVGYIDATGTDGGGNLDLGNLSISGDLTRIVAGDSNTATAGVKSLTVGSMGRYGTDTLNGVAPSQDSYIQGTVGRLTVRGDIVGGSFIVSGVGTAANGKLGALTIGGSLRGGTTNFSGFISSTGDLGPVTVRGNVIGGDGDFSGAIGSSGAVTSITIGGSLIGGGENGGHSGYLYTNGSAAMGPITIGRDVFGGRDDLSGVISTTGDLTRVTIGGSLLGGPDSNSGRIVAVGKIGVISIGGDLTGTASFHAGTIFSETEIVSVNIHGSLVGGVSPGGGQIQSLGKIGKVTIGRDVRGGEGAGSGQILSGAALGSVTIGGSLIGGANADPLKGGFSGSISSVGAIGSVLIGGDVKGGTGSYSGAIYSNTDIHGVAIGGSLLGGSGFYNGSLSSDGNLGFVKVGGDLAGGSADFSGRILAAGSIAGVSIGGSVLGSAKIGTGVISAGGGIGAVSIGGDLRGSDNPSSGTLSDTGVISGQRLASVTIGGSIVSGRALVGSLARSGAIQAVDDIGPLVVKGSIVGNASNHVLITARGQLAPLGALDVAVKSLSVGGNVEFTDLLLGYSKEGRGQNADAQIGAVSVGGDWIASSLVVGVNATDGYVGDANDVKLAGDFGAGVVKDVTGVISKIASIVIHGGVFGTPSASSLTDRFGFVAEQVGSFSANGTAFPLKAGASNDTFALGKALAIGAGRSGGTPDSFEVHVFEV